MTGIFYWVGANLDNKKLIDMMELSWPFWQHLYLEYPTVYDDDHGILKVGWLIQDLLPASWLS